MSSIKHTHILPLLTDLFPEDIRDDRFSVPGEISLERWEELEEDFDALGYRIRSFSGLGWTRVFFTKQEQ